MPAMNANEISVEPVVSGVGRQAAHEIWTMLVEADDSFVPPLSSRTSNTQSALDDGITNPAGPTTYFEALQNQQLILARVVGQQHRIAGFMSFRPDSALPAGDPDARFYYLTTVIVRPEHRGRGISKTMYETLFDAAAASNSGVATRTWSTNIAHIGLLEKLGFRMVHRITDDRGPGIDTEYYAKES